MEINGMSQLPKWYFSEMKGPTDDDCNEADQISALSFDSTGDFLATGDKGGRVVIFKANENDGDLKYDVYGTFTSHEAGFDYLKSVEIEEKINKIEWLPQINDSHCLLTTNDKVVKLWRVKERDNKPTSAFSNGSIKQASFLFGKRVESSCRKVFTNAHAFNINSLSVNSDQETFLSSDELRINIWNLQYTDRSFNIVDLKPPNMENLSEVITCAKFHPTNCATFVYSLSKRVVRLCDMRQKALCDEATLQFTDEYDTDGGSGKSFFSDIICSISDIQVSHSGQLLMARDYLTIKIWDMRYHKKPLQSLAVHDHFRAKLCALYENDYIFDRFECSWSPDDKFVLTGSYNNFIRQFNVNQGTSETLQVTRQLATDSAFGGMSTQEPLPNKFVSTRSSTSSNSNLSTIPGCDNSGINFHDNEVALDSLDLTKKLLHLCWHPKKSLLAIATTHNLFFLGNRQHQPEQYHSIDFFDQQHNNHLEKDDITPMNGNGDSNSDNLISDSAAQMNGYCCQNVLSAQSLPIPSHTSTSSQSPSIQMEVDEV